MIFVIVPLGKAAKDVLNWLARVLVYVASSVVGGALVGATAATVGALVYALVPGPDRAWPLLLIGVPALFYGLHEARLLRLPHPERAWQVPNSWVQRRPMGGTALFGLVLGSGLFTYIPYAGFYVLLAWEAATGNIMLGGLLGATYGLARGLPVIIGGVLILAGGHPLDLNLRLIDAMSAWHRAGSGVLVGLGAFLLAMWAL
ncbi:MAG: hypothetical protein ACR2M0_16765 [Chloroflexia bacterium]